MVRLRLRILVVLYTLFWLGLSHAEGQYSGLRFNGHEVPLDQRTSLNLTPKHPVKIGNGFKLVFDLKFEPGSVSYFGYIFRAVIDGENYDFIYSPQSNGLKNFHLVIGEEFSNISFYLPLEDVMSKWNTVKFIVDGPSKRVTLSFNDSVYTDNIEQKIARSHLHLFYGAHRYERYNSTDLPRMSLRSVKLFRQDNLIEHWPLNQISGTKVVNLISSRDGIVSNPLWILNLHTEWKLRNRIFLDGRITTEYDNLNGHLIVATEDSIIHYSPVEGTRDSIQINQYFKPNSNFHLVRDPVSGILYAYSLDLNRKIQITGNDSYEGDYVSEPIVTNMWHHNKMINPQNQVLFTFGGYGQLTYSNLVLLYNDFKPGFDTLNYSGTFHPRYLAGLGYNERDQNAYIIGGYGSRTGKQEISPEYYYELIRYSFKENQFEKVAEFPETAGDFCFSNSLHIDTTINKLYGLKFSKYEANPKLQAISVSLDDFEIEYLGDPFEFKFLDISATIDLYFDETQQKLLAITSYFEEDQTELEIHEISYPPVNVEDIDISTKSNFGLIIILLTVLSLVLIGIILRLVLRSNNRKISVENADEPGIELSKEAREVQVTEKKLANHEQPVKPGSIIIFGGFQVIDKNGKDITGSFTPLLKELFLFILLRSIRHNKGVSSEKLNEIFWFDKSDQSARNNRAVNIAKLRTLLEKVGDCHISKETGYWKFFFDPEIVYVDYYHYLKLAGSNEDWSKEELMETLDIVQGGPALTNINADWLDEIKAEISNEIIDGILSYIQRNENKKDPEFIIQLTNCIFHFDMANEEAMIIKCQKLVSLGKHSLAKKAYAKFEKEYEVLYGEKYVLSFNEVLQNKKD